MEFVILTIFPKIFDSFLKEGLLAKAQEKKIIKLRIINIRDYSEDPHHKVDDLPYGGGPGMVFKIEPLYRSLKAIQRKKKSQVILLDPKGKQFNQGEAYKFITLDQLILICGRYEGVDERINNFIDCRLSVGPYVLNGGEVAALTVIEATSRLIKGFLGRPGSLAEETFSWKNKQKEYPHFTRPEVFRVGSKKFRVPKVLLSGNHREIELWREKHRK